MRWHHPQPPGKTSRKGGLHLWVKIMQLFFKRLFVTKCHETISEAAHSPHRGISLPAIGIAGGLVEIGCGKAGIEMGQKPPWTIIEALASHIEIIGVENTMNKAGGKPCPGCRGNSACDCPQECRHQCLQITIRLQLVSKIMAGGMTHQHFQPFTVIKKAEPLKTADTNMTVG